MGKCPFVADFNVVIHPPERAEGTADTLRALHIVSKMSVCVINAFRTEYKTMLCDSNPKLSYNLIKMRKYPFAADFNLILRPSERAEGTVDTLRALHISQSIRVCHRYI